MKTFLLASVVPLAGAIAIGACGDDPTTDPPKETPEAGAPDVNNNDTPDTSTPDANVPEVDPLPKAGTRLKPMFTTTADGFKVYTGIYDSTLATFCIASKFHDTSLRCAPFP